MIELTQETILARTLVAVAQQFVGITEIGGDNKGQMVERFQKAVDGKAWGEPWCLAFQWYCIKETQRIMRYVYTCELNVDTDLKSTEHVMTMWKKSPENHVHGEHRVGDLIVWQLYKDGQPTSSGHVELVVAILDDNTVQTIGGNTSDGSGNPRDGDGVYSRTRIWRHQLGNLRHKGFLRVWP